MGPVARFSIILNNSLLLLATLIQVALWAPELLQGDPIAQLAVGMAPATIIFTIGTLIAACSRSRNTESSKSSHPA